MKRLFILLIAVVVVFFGWCTVSADAPENLYDDSNYILVSTQPQADLAWYIERNSLTVEKYNPPQYIISVNICRVSNASTDYPEIVGVARGRFFYNSDLGQMYVDRNGNSNWQYISPDSPRAYSLVSKPAGEMAFYLAYNMPFYGSNAGFYSEFYDPAD